MYNRKIQNVATYKDDSKMQTETTLRCTFFFNTYQNDYDHETADHKYQGACEAKRVIISSPWDCKLVQALWKSV